MTKIFTTLFYTVFIALVIGIAGLLLGTMLPIPQNIEIKIVKSGSMEPAISTGSLVVVKPVERYAVGDVITFGLDTKTAVPTTHRIIEIRGSEFIVKGDANEEADQGPVQRSEVIGKVIFSLPYAGYVLDFARQPLGFTLLIAIPAGLVILEEMLTIANETRKWWRGNSGGRAGGGGTPTLSAHLKEMYVRRRRMDEIFVKKRVEVGSPPPVALEGGAYQLSTVLVFSLVFMSSIFSSASGGTIAYFSDIERSVNNILRAGEWTEEVLIPEDELLLDALSLPFTEDGPREEGKVLGEAIAPEEEPVEPLPDPVLTETESEQQGGGGGGGGGSSEEPVLPDPPTEAEPDPNAVPPTNAGGTESESGESGTSDPADPVDTPPAEEGTESSEGSETPAETSQESASEPTPSDSSDSTSSESSPSESSSSESSSSESAPSAE